MGVVVRRKNVVFKLFKINPNPLLLLNIERTTWGFSGSQ
jgi:hypothetical protein